MKNTRKKWAMIASLLFAANMVQGQNFNNPNITEEPAIFIQSQAIPPNLFFILDDSGSMTEYWAGSETTYNPGVTYRVPPNPNDFNAVTGSFEPLPTPLVPVPAVSGYLENGLSTFTDWAKSPSDACPGASDPVNCNIFSAYYSTKTLAMKSSLANSLVEQSMPFVIDINYLNPDDGIATNDIEPIVINPGSSTYADNMKQLLLQIYKERGRFGTPTRTRYVQQYEKISELATEASRDNIFLPIDKLGNPDYSYDSDDLLYCRRNYSVILSDGGYNGSITENNNYDGTDKTLNFRNSGGEIVPREFKGDGSVPEQRLYAGGSNSLNPYDGNSNYLSDLAFQYWEQDLSGSLADEVSPIINVEGDEKIYNSGGDEVVVPEEWNRDNNPSYWQNVTTTTIGFGLGQAITDTQLADILSNPAATYSWTDSFYPNGTWREDHVTPDFVRSGYVGRGGFYKADTPEELQEAFEAIIEDALNNSQNLSTSAATVSAGQVTSSADNLMFSTSFNPKYWTGDLQGTWLYSGTDGSTPPLPSDKSNCFSSLPSEIFVGQLCDSSAANWSAQSEMNPANWSSRKIFSINRELSPPIKGIRFKAAEMNTTQVGHFAVMHDGSPGDLDSSVTNQEIIDFLSGDQTLLSTQSAIKERDDGILGDFGRGSPVFVGDPSSYVWGSNDASWPRSLKKGDRKVVFAGNNDGMLHAFDALSGKELFAYVPNSIYSKLKHRVLRSESHLATVDGQVAVQDIIDIHDSNTPKTILVSGLGAGARGLFALDVSDPNNFRKEDVLWELDENDDNRLGRIFAKPSIIRVEGKYKGSLGTGSAEENRWVVVVGTGYGNVGADSGIMVIDAISGEILDFLKLPGAQGLGEIAWVDHQKKEKLDVATGSYLGTGSLWGEVDRGYVADLRGNVWVLDFAYDKANTETELRSAVTVGSTNDAGTVNDAAHLNSLLATPGTTVDGEPAPLFISTDQAGNRQPITARITPIKHPSGRGYMLYVGTGDFLAAVPLVDNGNCVVIDCNPSSERSANSLYGIWDDIGDNIGDIATDDIEQYNVTRDRRFLTFYPWKQIKTQFVDGTQAFARVSDDSGSTAVLKTPIKWANLTGFDDSEAVALTNYTSDPVISSGWLTDTGYNTTLKQSERVFQPAALVINAKGEEGVTFYMHTLDTDPANADPCKPEGKMKTWQLSYRTDIIDGPLATFSASLLDNNSDGVIDENDKIDVSSKQIVPLGGIPVVGSTEDGRDKLVMGNTAIEGNAGNATGTFCTNGVTRVYTATLSDGTKKQLKTCRPFALSSWTELE